MIPVYTFDSKYVDDTDGFTFNLSAWLGDSDALVGTPSAIVTPADAVINNVTTSGSLVTVWVSGGVAETVYTIEIEPRTLEGRDCRIRANFCVEA
jgi:hypothetical protein